MMAFLGSWILNIEWSSTMLTTVFPPVKEYFHLLGDATQDILNFALFLAQQKQKLSKKEYRELLRNYKWEHEDKVYLKIAEIFHQFCHADLAAIEPNTLFILAKHHKKYAAVINELLSSGEINNETVRRLIEKHRKPSMSKEDKASIWRRTPQGGRYVQIPPIHNENTGVVLQKMIESEGLLAQQIISEAVSLREAFLQGRLAWVSDSHELESVTVEEFICNEVVNIEEIANLNVEDNDGCDDIDLDSSRVISLNYECDKPKAECLVNTPESLSNRLFDIVENIPHLSNQQVVEASQLVVEIIDYCNQKPASSQWEILAAITRRNGDALSIVIDYLESHRSEFFNLPQILALAAPKNPLELDWVSEQLRDKAVELMSVNLSQTVEVQQKVIVVGDKVNLKKCPPHLSSWQPFVVASIQGEFAMLEYYRHPVAIVDLDLIDTLVTTGVGT